MIVAHRVEHVGCAQIADPRALHWQCDCQHPEDDEEQPDQRADQRRLDDLRGERRDQHVPALRPAQCRPDELLHLLHPILQRRAAACLTHLQRRAVLLQGGDLVVCAFHRDEHPEQQQQTTTGPQHRRVQTARDLPDLGVDEQDDENDQEQGQCLRGHHVQVTGAADGLPHGPSDHCEDRQPSEYVDDPEQERLHHQRPEHGQPVDDLAIDALPDLHQFSHHAHRKETHQHGPSHTIGRGEPVAATVLRPETPRHEHQCRHHEQQHRHKTRATGQRVGQRGHQLQGGHHRHRRQGPGPDVFGRVVTVDELGEAVAREPRLGATDGVHGRQR